MKKKNEEQLEISVDFEGNKYYGLRFVTGKRVKYQRITFKHLEKYDSQQYRIREQHQMESFAGWILIELIKEYYIG